jgi:dolichyl-phosphate-mannose--protein O-mannosyl transferase
LKPETGVLNFSKMMLLLFFALFNVVFCKSKDHEKVTYGSAIKLTNLDNGYKLHSQDLQYATGSGQQTITGYPDSDDPNSLFVVQAEFGQEFVRGQPVKCNSIIRFELGV